jgi:hypothetical protein
MGLRKSDQEGARAVTPCNSRRAIDRSPSLGRLLDELDHSIGVRDHRNVAGSDLDRCGVRSLRELHLGVRRQRLVVVGDEILRRNRLPCRGSHHIVERGPGQSLLHGVHHPCLHGVHIGSEVMDEVVFGELAETLLVGKEMLERWCQRSLRQQCA